MFDRTKNTTNYSADLSLFQLFGNYAGTAQNALGIYPLSFLELSKPTGRYVSRFLLRELNLFTRRHSIIMLGNNCAPGYFFPALESGKGMEQFRRELKHSCVVFIANTLGHQAEIPGAVVFEAEPFMLLKIQPHWQNTQDYLAEMHSKYRVRTKKVLESSASLARKSFTGENIEPSLLRWCAEMLQQTLRKKTLAMNKDLNGIIQRFAEHFGSDYRIHVYYQNQKPIGFITCTIRQAEMIAWQVGYAPEIAKETHIYQRMLFDLIELAIGENVKQINFGRTATEIKSTFGAEPLDNQFVVFTKSRVLRAMMEFYKKRHFRPKEYTIRRPFKTG